MASPAPDWQQLSPYLDRALELPLPERAAWLAELRKQDPQIANGVEALLEEHRALADAGFLDRPPVQLPNRMVLAGQRVGPYTLVARIAQGGMGSVWMARRRDGEVE